ncbi:MAG: HNH endonuclease signature motif containing protein [Planctomycetota bacterium]|jgi:hypothetical protein
MNRPICKLCNTYPVKKETRTRNTGEWRDVCSQCNKKAAYVIYKSDHCQSCGFVPVNRVQLDVDHIDGNRTNNDPDNLQTLCANCHRLKTYLNKDWQDKEIQEMKTLQMDLI